jgi:hypothetical protein
MNPTNKVQTRQTFEEWNGNTPAPGRQSVQDHRRDGWNAALDSVILPEGKRFEIGDGALRFEAGDTWISGRVVFLPDGLFETFNKNQQFQLGVDKLDKFRPIPQTVDLTDDEKLHEVEQAMKKRSEDSAIAVVRDLAKQLTLKTLDQLCADYNVPTTREI